MAIGLALDESRSLAGSRAIHGRAHCVVHLKRVRTVHGHTRNAERFRLLRQWIAGLGVRVFQAHVRVCLVFVILENKNDRQLPHSRHVQRLVERSLLRRAVAEERINHLSCFFYLRGVRGAGCMRDSLADDPRRCWKMARRIGQVHGPAESFADAIFALVYLRHQSSRGRAQHKRITVAAVTRHHQVVFLPRREAAHDACLRAVRKMRVAANHARMLHESSLHAFLELADPAHLRVHPDQAISRELA